MKTSLFSHSRAIFATIGTLALAGSAHATLSMYDAAIAGGPATTAVLTSAASVDTTFGIPFDFGAVSGSSTAEFIIDGDPVAQGQNGFLAVGANGTWNLRYEQWDDTGQLGFTHLGVADYLFTPAVTSPTEPTHVAYRWDQPTETMDVFVDGDLLASQAAPGYEMPAGAGFLGAKDADGAEGMLGTFYRVTVYDSALDGAEIKAHSDAFGGVVPEPSTALLASLGVLAMAFRRRR